MAPIYDEAYSKTQIDVSAIYSPEEIEAFPQVKGKSFTNPSKNEM